MHLRSRLFTIVTLISCGAALAAVGCSAERFGSAEQAIEGEGGNASSASSSGGGDAVANDGCPGEARQLGIGSLTLSGSTIGAASDFDTPAAACFGSPDASGADVVYAVTFTESGTLSADLTSSNGLNGILAAQTACGDDAALLLCSAVGASGSLAESLPVTAGQTIYFVVDGEAGTAGDYALSLTLAAAACGDGIVNDGEACDDGNTLDGDGCSASCTLEAPTDASDTCPGEIVSIDLSQTLDLQGVMAGGRGPATTMNYADDYTTCDGVVFGSPSGTGPDQGGNDRVFQFVPSSDGTLSIQLRNVGLEGGFDGMLSAWANTCAPAPASAAFDWTTGTDAANGDYLGCSDHAWGDEAWSAAAPNDPMTQESLTFAVTANTPYFVVVDGYAGYSAGKFWLHAELAP